MVGPGATFLHKNPRICTRTRRLGALALSLQRGGMLHLADRNMFSLHGRCRGNAPQEETVKTAAPTSPPLRTTTIPPNRKRFENARVQPENLLVGSQNIKPCARICSCTCMCV